VPSYFKFERFELRPGERALLEDGKALRLGGRAFDILLALVERRDRIVEFDELLDVVWPGLAVEENNLSVQISALRKLLGTSAITTVRGKGYRFTAPIRESSTAEEPAPVYAPRLALRQPWGAVLVVRAADAALQGVPPTTPVGVAVGRAMAGEWNAESLGLTGEVIRFDDGLGVAFECPEDAARAALKVLRHRPARVAVVTADLSGRGDAAVRSAAWRAHALAGSAGFNELIVTAELASEFVPGIDGDVEDLGDLVLPTGTTRAYRVRPAAMASPWLAELDRSGCRPSIAVLPFEGLVGMEADDMLGEAVADDVITCLARNSEFNVISGLSSRRLKRCGLPVDGMAQCLAAGYLLTGTCRSSGGRISLNAQLQDVRRGAVVRSMHMEVSPQQAFDPADPVGHRLAREVAEAVFAHSVQQCKARPFPELGNYALLMGAVGLMHRTALQEFERARAMLEHLALRPGCQGVAAAWLAKWHVLRAVQGWSIDASADARLALEYVARSLEEDSRDALALSIGGLVHAYLRKDLATAGRLYEEAIDANPSEPLAWLFTATRHAWLGEGVQAEEAGERALRLSPIDPLKYFFDSLAATAALANARWERSVELSQRSLKANRAHASTWRTLAFALVMLNRMDEAKFAVQRLLAIEPGFTVGRFLERFPGRDGPLARPWAEALKAAELPS
jgi:adenylate cyclase